MSRPDLRKTASDLWPAMTRIVDGLEQLGPAGRAPHPDTARMTLVRATEGAVMAAAAGRRFEAMAAGLRGPLARGSAHPAVSAHVGGGSGSRNDS